MSVVSQVWECPQCGSEVIIGEPGRFRPLKCGFGHEPCEMEQKIVRPEHAEQLPEASER